MYTSFALFRMILFFSQVHVVGYISLVYLQAFLYSEAPGIVGVEIDKTFCELQQGIIQQYNLTDRIKVMESHFTVVSLLI